MNFQHHCENMGIELLPEDVNFIRERLKSLPRANHKVILTQYADMWIKVMAECEDELRGVNLARRCANGFLRDL